MIDWRDRGAVRPRPYVVSLLLVMLAAVLAAVAAGAARADARPPVLRAANPSGIVFARDSRPSHGGGGSPNLVYHGGSVMNGTSGTAARAIFWGSSWTDGAEKVKGIDSFYNGVGGTNYLGTTTEYTDPNGPVVNSLSYSGHYLDSTAAPQRAPSTSDVLNVVAATLKANGNQSPVPNGYYPVYSDQPRGHAGYCAWHSWGTIGGTPVEFAFFFNLDGDPGCNPNDTYNDGHSQGLAALGNVSGHELSETLTDPNGNAWYDQSGAENADKCAWTFGQTAVTLSDGSTWKIQGNWSNAAYTAGSGSYLGSSSGCIDGN